MVLPVVVALKFILPVKLLVIPDIKVSDPCTSRVKVPAILGELVAPVQSIFAQAEFTFMVTVCAAAVKEFASKKTLSAKVGTSPPEVPPLEVAQ